MTATQVDVLAPVEQEGTKASVKVWLKQVGERVEAGEPLLELETDKVAMEVTAPATGVLTEIVVHDGGEAGKGAVLGRLTIGDVEVAAAPAAVADTAAVPAVAPAVASAERSIASFDPALRLSPAVRRRLLDTGIDPRTLTGSGRGGRITSTDVERAAATMANATATATGRPAGLGAPRATTPSAGPLSGTRIPHDTMRRRIAEHMARSLATAPHVTATFEADFSAIMAHREASRAAFSERGVPLTLTAYLVLAVVEAMKAVPIVNSRWHDDFVEVFDDINVGVGTALGDKGLVVPVVHRAQTLSLLGVATRLQEATTAARAGTLTPADVQGGTFTISNHGVSGSLTAAPIVINQPQAAILGVGKVEKRVVVRETESGDAILVRPMSYVTLSIDHRVIDGAQTNAWLTRFVQALETWPAPGAAPSRRGST
ncbi:MAG TPA: 2-oxo acid dehydrogenase subunit E2 [Vicinamibacterales bacterium]|nr:2-oxo acid dehydrogenase subunit E2 [Vicinamibacterales bacterium]